MWRQRKEFFHLIERLLPRLSFKTFVYFQPAPLSGNKDIIERPIYGYTIVDSLKAITTFNVFGDLYGWSNERAIFFSGVHYGRSPMIAIRAHPVKPRVVIYIKPKTIDKLASKLAEMERIVLVKTELDEEEIVKILKKIN